MNRDTRPRVASCYALQDGGGALEVGRHPELAWVFSRRGEAEQAAEERGLSVRRLADPYNTAFMPIPRMDPEWGDLAVQRILLPLLTGDAQRPALPEILPVFFAVPGEATKSLEALRQANIPVAIFESGHWVSPFLGLANTLGVRAAVVPMTTFGEHFGDPWLTMGPTVSPRDVWGLRAVHPGWLCGVSTKPAASLYLERLFQRLADLSGEFGPVAFSVNQLVHLIADPSVTEDAFLEMLENRGRDVGRRTGSGRK